MGVVTALRVQERDKDRVSIFVDGEYAFSLPILAAAQLYKGQELSEAEQTELAREGTVDLARQQALRFLSYRPRSTAEVEAALLRKGHAEDVVAEAIARLQRGGLIDDEAFARFWVDNRTQFKARSAKALRYELRQKGVEKEVIDEAVEEVDDEAAAWAAVESKVGRWEALEQRDFEQKVIAHLGRRGFNFDVARRTARRAWNSKDEG
jgi:regulatory protein